MNEKLIFKIMNTKMKFIALICFMSMGFIIYGQRDYGKNKQETLKNYSLYDQNYKTKQYKEAYPYWRYVFDNAPKFSMSTYSRGAFLIKKLYKQEKDPKYWDELMEVYAKRIMHYGKNKKYPKGYVLGKKGLDIYKYKKDEPESLKRAYDTLIESINLQQTKSEPSVIDKTMASAIELYNKEQIDRTSVIDNFIKLDKISTKALEILKDPKKIKKMQRVKNNIQSYFIISECASCSDLTNIFEPKFEEVKDDVEELNNISRILDRFECNDTDFFNRIAKRQYELEPSADAAYSLGAYFLKKKNLPMATQYLYEASKQQTDPYKKANIHMKLSKLNLAQGKLSSCKQQALKALAIRPRWGEPNLILAQAYAIGAQNYSKDAYQKSTVFWTVVDRLYKAKKDLEFARKASILINKYSKYYPNCEELFFRSVQRGSSVKIGGWINENTTARCRK